MSSTSTGRVTIEEGVVFGTGGGRDLKCDVYTPPGRPENAPAVLLVHGGSWRNGDRTQLRGYGVLIGREGYLCVCTEYRLLGEATWPAQIHDVKAAIRWMRANSSHLGLDPERVVIEGNSAGGHLALLAAGTPGRPDFEGEGGNAGVPTDVAAVLAVYPPTDLATMKRGVNEPIASSVEPDEVAEIVRTASPINYVTPDFPPTLLIHGTKDEVVPHHQSVRMYQALEKAGVPVELHTYGNQPHAFDAQPEYGRQTAATMLAFLKRFVANPAKVAVSERAMP